MDKKDLIIGCSTNYDWSVLKYWVNSINSCGFEGDKVLILMTVSDETVQKVVDAGFHVVIIGDKVNGGYLHKSSLPVHVERFVHIAEIISHYDYRYVITTDVKDVIFQKNPIEFLEDNGDALTFSSESMKYKDEPWGNQNLLETFGEHIYQKYKNNIIYNVGVLAGEADYMKDLCLNIFMMSINRPIPIVDQSTFNFIISNSIFSGDCYYVPSEMGWACQLGTTADPSKIEQFRPYLLEPSPVYDGGKVCTQGGREYYIVHQYDRTPWRKDIESQYGG